VSEQEQSDPIVMIGSERYRFNEMSEESKQLMLGIQNLTNSITSLENVVGASRVTLDVKLDELKNMMPEPLPSEESNAEGASSPEAG